MSMQSSVQGRSECEEGLARLDEGFAQIPQPTEDGPITGEAYHHNLKEAPPCGVVVPKIKQQFETCSSHNIFYQEQKQIGSKSIIGSGTTLRNSTSLLG